MSMPARTDAARAAEWDAHSADYASLFAPLTGHIARSMVLWFRVACRARRVSSILPAGQETSRLQRRSYVPDVAPGLSSPPIYHPQVTCSPLVPHG